MTRETFVAIQSHMLAQMGDSAHDCQHIYRVLGQALSIAENYPVDLDILIASCLLHDIGRRAQFDDPKLCHAVEGGKIAYAFLKTLGWAEDRCLHVRDCVTIHRYRSDAPPKSIEAKILFDADKLDVTGALGIARTLLYQGKVGDPLYTVDKNLHIQTGLEADAPASFLKEYHGKLNRLYDSFYTPEATAVAQKRKAAMEAFYAELMEEIDTRVLWDALENHLNTNGQV